MSSVNEDIGIRLRKVRGAHDLSQRALARRTGVSNAMISLIENGRSNPSIGMLRQIKLEDALQGGVVFQASNGETRPSFHRYMKPDD